MNLLQPDFTFERDGKSLGHWVLELVSPDAGVRQEAGDAVAAMFYGVPSMHTDLDDIEGGLPDGDDHRTAWENAIEEVVCGADFPRQSFFIAAAAQLIAAHEELIRDINVFDEQYERVCERIGERLKAAGNEEERQRQMARMNRAICAMNSRQCKVEPPIPEAMSHANMAVSWIIPFSGRAMLEVPEAFWMLIESESQADLAYEAIERAGPEAAPLFLDHLVKRFKRTKYSGRFDRSATLASVGRGDRRVIDLLLDALADWRVNGAWGAAWTMHAMGPSALTHERTMPVLQQLTESPQGQRRAAVAYALGGVGRDVDDAVEPLLKLTHDRHADEDGYGGHIVAGCAMSALGRIARRPDLVVPRIAEMFETFEEFDSDMGYGGSHARQCDALEAFGSAAAAAVPTLVDYLERCLASDPEEWNDDDVLDLLGSLGPSAADALPVLEKSDRAWQEYCLREEALWDEEEDEDDEDCEDEDDAADDEEEEESAYRRAIRRIRGE